jgi:two-component system alkaline phosphatase synthesis response regulator PhoP
VLLVVDDDAAVLAVSCEALARAGFEVLRAKDGASALAAFRQRAKEIRAVVLDLNMPGASGEDICEALWRLRPELKIVLVSGYAQEHDPKLAQPPGRADFLAKPFLPATLLEKVRTLLDT